MTTTPFAGRATEQEQLALAFAAAAEGRGAVILLSGEGGAGKTTLAERALEQHVPLRTIRARMLEGQATAYGALADLLRDSLRRASSSSSSPSAGRLPARPPAYLKPLSPLFPEWSGLPAGGGPDGESLTPALRHALLETCGDEPAIFFLDDAQWADESSLELLPLLAAAVAGRKIALMIAYRSDELKRDHPVRRLRARLRREKHCLELALGPLTEAETAEMLAGILGQAAAPALVREVVRRTQGLPLFVEELCRTLNNGGHLEPTRHGLALKTGIEVPVPESIRDAVLLQLDSLTEPARTAVEAAAVLGLEFELDLLEGLGLHEPPVDELMDCQLLVPAGAGRAAFRHSLTRESILGEIPWSAQRDWHGKAADLLARRGAATHQTIARHLKSAGRSGDAREKFLDAARDSCAVHAYRDAAQAFEEALALWPEGEAEDLKAECMERLAECAQVAGYFKDAARVLQSLVGSPALHDDPLRRARALRTLASVLEMQGAAQPAEDARLAALSAFEAAGQFDDAAAEALALAESHIVLVRLAAAQHHSQRALDLARRAAPERLDLESRCLSALGLALAMQGKKTVARRRIEEALELALKHQLKVPAAIAYQRMAYVSAYVADYKGYRDAFGTAINFCQSEGLDAEKFSCLGCMSYAIFRLGDWNRAASLCSDVLASPRSSDGAIAAARTVLGELCALRGQVRQARKNLRIAEELARRYGMVPLEFLIRFGLAILDELEENDDRAAARYRDTLALWRRTDDRLDVLPALCMAATFFGRRRLKADLGACADVARRIATENANPESIGSLAFVIGESLLAEDQFTEAAGQFLQARKQFGVIEARYDMARGSLRAGAALLAAHAEEPAIEHLRKCYQEARSLGARPLMADASRLLEEAGARPTEERDANAPRRAVQAGLTRRQMEVAALLAEGMTNKEVAQNLSLSPRTIDMHVGHLLDRLDCRTRAEAVRKLVELGLVD